MGFHSRQIAAPKYWEEFEDLCLDLFRRVWADPTAQKNGRRGQSQHGTDIWGTPTVANGAWHGVQCKGKDAGYGASITETELRGEIEKAKKFSPKLAHWILATTAPNDAGIEAIARQITEKHKKEGLFAVQVFGWEDLQSLISDHPEVMEKHYRDQAPATRRMLELFENIGDRGDPRDLVLEFQSLRSEVYTLIAAMSKDSGARAAIDADDIALHARVDEARDLLRDGQPRTALRRLEWLIDRYWGQASPRARFRLLTNRAAALLEVGDEQLAPIPLT